MFQVLRNENDFLKEFVGETYNRKSLSHINSFYKDRFSKYGGRNLNKFSLVTCLDQARKGKEILSIGGSSLLKDKNGNIEPNLFLDNWGLFLAQLIAPSGGGRQTVFHDITGTLFDSIIVGSSASNSLSQGSAVGSLIQMGSGTSAPTRADFKIQTALGNAPESGIITGNQGAYTASNTVIYQADANPTGGSGTVNEICAFMTLWASLLTTNKTMAITHDSISPSVSYASGKLLRGSYTWQI